jgi:thermitase
MLKVSARGFIHIPIIIIILAVVGVGGYTVSNVIQKSQEFNQQTSEPLAIASLPKGAASAEEILVGFRKEVPVSQKENIHRNTKSLVKKTISKLNTDVVIVESGLSVSDAINKYKTLSEVEYVEPNFLASAFLSPNDPLYGNQWNLKKVLAEQAFDVSNGGGSTIAVIDTGIDSTHPDLSGLVLTGLNTIDGSSNTSDSNSHGTHVAGIAAAQTNNGSGIASISYQSKVLPVKVLGGDGSGTYSDVAEGIVYAADNGARVINMSLGGSSDSTTLKNAVNYALGRGSMIVASAGNNGNSSPSYPASYPGVLSVSASDQSDNLASFSSYGNNVFVASPGVSITSSVPGGGYKQYNGTSMAAPHLAGLIALVLSKNPGYSNSEVLDQIKKNSEKVGPYSYDQNGWNPYYGYGRISSGKTLQNLASPSPSATPSATPDATLKPSNGKSANKGKRFSFNLNGTVDGVDLEKGKFSVKVEGGNPDFLELVVNNLVDIYIGGNTVLKTQSHGLNLSDLTSGARVQVRGKSEESKLMADEVISIKGSGQSENGQSQNAAGNTGAANGNTQNNSANSNSSSSNTQSNLSSENKQSFSANRSENIQDKGNNGNGNQGKVKGISTVSFPELIITFIRDLSNLR